jgi:hypothetical protein
MQNRLFTGDCLASWGFNGNVQCLFYRNSMEIPEHLFFECRFNHRIWEAGMPRCIVDNPSSRWEEVMSLGSKNWNGNSLHATLCKLVLSSSMYNLWSSRNEIKHNGHPKTEDRLLKVIFWEVRSRILRKEKFPKSRANVVLCQAWNIPADLLI